MELTDSDLGPEMIDYLILGAGPAGVQLAYFLARSGRSYRVLEAGDAPGTFFRRFPRHRMLISINKLHTGYEDSEINLRWDWNSLLSDDESLLFRHYSEDYFPQADTLVQYLADFARRFELQISHGWRATRVERTDGSFVVSNAAGERIRARHLIVATGVSRAYVPDIPGIEHAESYTDVSIDPADFVGERVLVLGKGNSAFETADNLIKTTALVHVASPNPVKLAWKTHYVGNLRAVNNNFLDTYQLKAQNAIIDAEIDRIERIGGELHVTVRYSHANGERECLRYDRIINCTGFRFDPDIFAPECRPALAHDDRLPALSSAWESTNVRGMYFTGVLSQSCGYKRSTSAFIHGFRYNVRALHRILETRNHGTPWPEFEIACTPEGLREWTLDRVNRTSALWQQFGYLVDILVPDAARGVARYYEEMPLEYAREWAGTGEFYAISLEFGKVEGDPFAIDRKPHPHEADRSVFLHPVVRRYVGGRVTSELHLLENLYGEWTESEQHHAPLEEFFAKALASSACRASEPAPWGDTVRHADTAPAPNMTAET